MPVKRRTTGDSGLEVYTVAEIDSILESLRDSRIEGVVILMAKGSCRVGEAAAAAVKDITFDDHNGRTYAVYNLYHQYSQNNSFEPLKTQKAAVQLSSRRRGVYGSPR